MFKGKGMPILNNNPLSPMLLNHTHGDFFLQFSIVFPQEMPSAKTAALCKVLEEAEEADM